MKKLFLKSGLSGLLLGTAFLIALTGCADRSQTRSATAPGLANQDDYVYYPGYQTYYGNRSQRWYYQENHSWTAHSAPRGVTVKVLQSAPSVPMDFHDSPAAHHAQVVQQYPQDWKSPAGNPERENH